MSQQDVGYSNNEITTALNEMAVELAVISDRLAGVAVLVGEADFENVQISDDAHDYPWPAGPKGRIIGGKRSC